jgi:hypothetical protein
MISSPIRPARSDQGKRCSRLETCQAQLRFVHICGQPPGLYPQIPIRGRQRADSGSTISAKSDVTLRSQECETRATCRHS